MVVNHALVRTPFARVHQRGASFPLSHTIDTFCEVLPRPLRPHLQLKPLSLMMQRQVYPGEGAKLERDGPLMASQRAYGKENIFLRSDLTKDLNL